MLPTSPSGQPVPIPRLARLHRASVLLAPALGYLIIRQVRLPVVVRTLAALTAFSAWFGSYSITVWAYAS